MQLTVADGQTLNLDFEPLATLANDSRYYVPTILEEINRGIYAGMIAPGSTVIDLGANIGLFSLYASAAAKVVYAVEPTPEHLAVLILSAFVLNIKNIVPVPAAIWTRDGELSFYRDPNNTTMNRVDFQAECYEKPATTDYRVPCYTLESLMDANKIERAELVKMDIEGAELDVIRSEGFIRAVPRVDAVYVECHNFKDWNDGTLVAEQVRDALLPHFPAISGFWARGMLARKA